MRSRANIVLVCLLIASMLFVPIPSTAVEIWETVGFFDDGLPNYIFSNPGYSSGPDFYYNKYDGTMAAAWIDTYDDGLFQPAYARFNGYSWRNASYYDTHSIDFEKAYFRRLDYSKAYAESVSKVMIAPKRPHAGYPPDIHPIMVAGWIFNDEKFNGTELFYCDLNSYGTFRRWYSISWSKSNKTNFDIYYDEYYIYATWLEWVDDDKCYQVMASRYSYDNHYWMPMENDNNNVLSSTRVTTTPGSKFTPKIASIPEGSTTTPVICWEEDGDIHMVKWDPSTEPLPTPHIKRWVSLLGEENKTTNVSNTPFKESHDPDFAIDNSNNPIVVWGEENAYNRLGIACSRWNGGSWWDYQSQPGFSFVGDTITEGDIGIPRIDLLDNDNPVITWQYYNDGEKKSYVTIRDYGNFCDINGNPGFTEIDPATTGSEDVTPLVVPYEDWSDDDDEIILTGVVTPRRNFFDSPQTDIFYQKITRESPKDDIEYQTRIVTPGRETGWNEGWFPITKSQGDNEVVEYRITVRNLRENPQNKRLFLHFNTVVRYRKFSIDRITYTYTPPPQYNLIPYVSSKLNSYETFYHHLEYDPTATGSPSYPSESYRRPMKWLSIWYENALTNIEEITFTLRVEYTVPFTDTYITNNPGDNNFDPMASPQFYYTHMITSLDYHPPFPLGYEDDQFHNFVGFNVPYSYNNLIVTPEFHYLNACSPREFFNIILRSPWGENVDFHYELSVDNWDQLIGIMTWFRNESGDSENGVVVTGMYALADCLASATWFTPRIKAEFSRIDDPDNIKYSTKEVKLLVRKPHIYGSKTANTSMATVGDVVYYTITVGNKGSGSAYDVEVVDVMPHDLEFLNSSIAGKKNGNNVSFVFEEIGPGEEYKIKIACRIRTDAHIKSGDVITNTARISGLEKDLSTNMGITVRGTVPGCEMPQVEMVIDKHKLGESIKAGEEFDCKMLIHRGCNPFDVIIFWDDNGNSDRFEIGESMEHNFTHTYDEPGEYLVRVSVADEYGKMVNLYKHIHVKSK